MKVPRVAWIVVPIAIATWLVWRSRGANDANDAATASPAHAAAQPAPDALSASESASAVERRAGSVTDIEPPKEHEVALTLRRFPDDAPLDTVAVRFEPPAASGTDEWRVTDGRGRVDVTLRGATMLHVDAVGYQPADVAVEAAASEIAVALTPSSGVFGRVIAADAIPASDVEVWVEVPTRRARVSTATRTNPGIQVFENRRTEGRTRSNARGFYFVPCETRFAGPALRVLARSNDAQSAALDVDLPRAPEQLADLALTPGAQLVARVIDETGTPIEGAYVQSRENPRPYEQTRSGKDGRVLYVAPALPANFTAGKPGFTLREARLDGQAIAGDARVESCEHEVELVLVPQPGLHIRFLDAETHHPIAIGNGQGEMFAANQPLGSIWFELGDGDAWMPFADRRGQPLPRLPDVVRVGVNKDGYDSTLQEIDVASVDPSKVLEISVEPEPGSSWIRGRVMRDRAAVPRLQIGLTVSVEGRQWDYRRCFTDEQGRFAFSWKAKPGAQLVTVFPHVIEPDEFGFLGPMSAADAAAKEHVLELTPGIRVPAILRNIVASARYAYYIALEDGSTIVDTTINGNPIALDRDGEARTSFLLPSRTRVRVTIGYLGDGSYQPNASEPVEFDPSSPVLPLVFDVKAVLARVSGRVTGLSDDELRRASAGFAPAHSEDVRMTQLDATGKFELRSVPLGAGDVLLVVSDGPYNGKLLAKMPLMLTGDVQGLVLTPDPASLPERIVRER